MLMNWCGAWWLSNIFQSTMMLWRHSSRDVAFVHYIKTSPVLVRRLVTCCICASVSVSASKIHWIWPLVCNKLAFTATQCLCVCLWWCIIKQRVPCPQGHATENDLFAARSWPCTFKRQRWLWSPLARWQALSATVVWAEKSASICRSPAWDAHAHVASYRCCCAARRKKEQKNWSCHAAYLTGRK